MSEDQGNNGGVQAASPMRAVNMRFITESGVAVIGRTEEWVAAIVNSLPPEVQRRVLETVAQKRVAYEDPKHRVAVLQPAEFDIGFKKL